MNDTTVRVIMVIILICHLVTITIGYKIKKTTLSISYLNAIFVIGILAFFVIDTQNIAQHPFEFREVFVLGLEASILIFALYAIMGFYNKTYVKVINYIGFWFHTLAIASMLVFMFTFKLERLY